MATFFALFLRVLRLVPAVLVAAAAGQALAQTPAPQSGGVNAMLMDGSVRNPGMKTQNNLKQIGVGLHPAHAEPADDPVIVDAGGSRGHVKAGKGHGGWIDLEPTGGTIHKAGGAGK